MQPCTDVFSFIPIKFTWEAVRATNTFKPATLAVNDELKKDTDKCTLKTNQVFTPLASLVCLVGLKITKSDSCHSQQVKVFTCGNSKCWLNEGLFLKIMDGDLDLNPV